MDSFRSSPDYSSLKEPRGFIRILQLVFAICAFATTCGFTATFGVKATCMDLGNKTRPVNENHTFSYPFALSSLGHLVPICAKKNTLFGDYSSSSQFFVFVGVITLLYCIGILLLYIMFVTYYESSAVFKNVDYVISLFIAFIWFVGSCAWASGTDQLKRYTTSAVLKNELCEGVNACDVTGPHAFAGLNISLVFGFANVALWAASLWFLWKETSWYSRPADQMMSSVLPPVDESPM